MREENSEKASKNFDSKRKEGVVGFFSGLAEKIGTEVSNTVVSIGWMDANMKKFQDNAHGRFMQYFQKISFEQFWYCYKCKVVAPIGNVGTTIDGEV